MRKKIIAGNWKMNLQYAEAMALVDAVTDSGRESMGCEVIIAPPFIYLHDVVGRIQSKPDFSACAQNCSQHQKGAYTGEVSAAMLASIGVDFVIIGHSERRTLFGETGDVLAGKLENALKHGLIPIFCCGESLKERESNMHRQTVNSQLEEALFKIDKRLISECIIAYEPVWAIGTGKNATPEQAGEMHAHIRTEVERKFGPETATGMTILYGGSVTPANARGLFEIPDIDGALVGGASLKPADFLSIIGSMKHCMDNASA